MNVTVYSPSPRHRCVHEWFEQEAQRRPEAVAVRYGRQELTYGELNARANFLGHHLRSLDVVPDDPVGVCVERSLDMVVALLGILKAGGAYLPLDPRLPQQRLGHQMTQARCAVVVTQSPLVEMLDRVREAYDPPLHLRVRLDETAGEAAQGDMGNPPPVNDAHHLAYVLFTSGSTGRPKGVEMPHRALVNLLHWQCGCSTMGAGNRTLQFASLGFDVSFQEIFATLLSGGTLVLVADDIRKDPAALLAYIIAEKVDRIMVPYFVLERLAEAAASSNLVPVGLKEVMVAGEQLRIGTDIRRLFQRLPGCRLWNQYGPTEAHVVTSHELLGPAAEWPDLPPIGRPLPNCPIYLLDSSLTAVPAGEVGELYLGGVALARGYLNAPELTAERFVTDPFGSDPRARIYRTGDLARYLPDGNLEFLGRTDHQVKIRGHRVELGEVEAVLGRHPDVSSCAVMPRIYHGAERFLAAYLVGRGGAELSVGTLRKWLADTLPEAMIPSCYFVLDALPLNPNGKLDRQALEKLDGVPLATGDDYVAPRNPVEAKLVEIWQKLFDRQDIGCKENFFDLGGHSLLAVQLTVEIEQQMCCKLPIAALLQSPTIEALARRFTDEAWSPPFKSLVPLQPLGSKPPLYLVHGWGGDVYGFMGLAKLLAPDQPVYGIQALGMDGKVGRHTTVASMAAHYVAEIRAFQPEGPYFLGGYSLGGLFAFEVAQQLFRQNQRVATLAVMDSEPIGGISWIVYGRILANHFCGRLGLHLRRWRKLPFHQRIHYLHRIWASLRALLCRNQRQAPLAMHPPHHDSQTPQLSGFDDYYCAVAASYRLRPYPGMVDFFVSDESDSRWLLSWTHLARGGITFHRIACPHDDIISANHVAELASAMRRVLTRAQDDSACENHRRQQPQLDSRLLGAE